MNSFWESLAGRLFKLVFSWYLVLAFAVTSMQLVLEYSSIRRNINNSLNSIGHSFVASVADALWVYDHPQLDVMAKGIVQNSFVTGVRIESIRGETIIQAGVVPGQSEATREGLLAPYQLKRFELGIKSPRGEKELVGQMLLYSDRSVALERVKDSFIVILINSLIKTAGLWLIFYLVISRSLSRHLSRLREIVTRMEFAATSNDPISLDYPYQDELGSLLGAMNQMQQRLSTARRQLETVNESLELRVAERTVELRESEEKYRVLFHNELYAVCIFDLETLRFLDANDAHVKLYGYSKEELMGGMTALELSAQHQESDSSLKQIVASRITSYIPLRYHKKKDGTVFPVEIVGGPYFLHGKDVMFALVRDISEIKQAEIELQKNEERFRKLFEDNIMVILIINPVSGEIIEANGAASKFYGWSIQELRQMFIWDINTLPLEKVKAIIGKARSSGSMRSNFIHLRSDGTFRNVEVSISRIQIKGKNFLYSIVNDITDRILAEEALKNAKNLLEQRVIERTSELEKSNATLSTMLDYARKTEVDIQERVVANLRTNILSLLDSLKKEKLPINAQEIVSILEQTTQNLAHPLARNLESNLLQLTAREIHLANLIQLGKTTKDLTKLLNVTPRTIESHRNNIRKKLGLRGKKINLRTYLDTEFKK